MGKIRKVCAECGSEEVQADAYVTWNVERQDWEISCIFDKGSTCDNCDGECRIIDIPDTEDDLGTAPMTRKSIMINADQGKKETISEEW